MCNDIYVCLMTNFSLLICRQKTVGILRQLYDIPIVYGYVILPTRLLINVVSAVNTRGMY